MKTVLAAFRLYFKDGCIYLSAAISFYAILSFIPLIFFVMRIFALVLGRHVDMRQAVLQFVHGAYPVISPGLGKEIDRMAAPRGAGLISFIIFLWVGSLVFSSLEYSINRVFRSLNRLRFFSSRLMSFALVIFSGFLFTVSFWLTYIPTFIGKHKDFFGSSKAIPFLTATLLVKAVPVVLTCISFTLLYLLLPRRKIDIKDAAIGGIVAGLLWEAAKLFFAWYVGRMETLSLYGSFTTIILFMVWIYYSATIFLLVAEGLYVRARREHRIGLKKSR
ncbi:MAG: YihY/virulence factor BrkB family protein [Nitrospirota bacterium]